MHSPVIREITPPLSNQATGIAAQVYARSHDLEQLNERLCQAHAREREIAVTLQEVMLRSPDLDRHREIAVRYLPAYGTLNVCGDWYDVVDLPPDATPSPSPSATSSATAGRPPPSWACCAAP